MKDPASDFLLKHQPPEYYKCHLQAVLEKEVDEVGEKKENGARCHLGDEAETFEWCGVSLSLWCVNGRGMRFVPLKMTVRSNLPPDNIERQPGALRR